MDTVTEVAGGVGQVHCRRIDEIFLGAPVLADIGGGDGLDAFRQRGISRGERVVVVEDPASLGRAEAIRQHDVASSTSACLITWWR
jgi:hypothetical protein